MSDEARSYERGTDRTENPDGVPSVEAAASAGLLFVVLYSVALALLSQLPNSSTPGEVVDWYSRSENRLAVIIGLNLAVFSGIAFLWFIGVIRRRVGQREDRFLATAFLASGILFVGAMLTGTTALASGVLSVEFLNFEVTDPKDVAVIGGFGWGILLVVVPRIQAVFLIGTSRLSARTEAIPQWLTYFGYVIAALMIVMPIMWEPVGFAFPVWVGVTSVVLFIRRRSLE